jgi:probable F420-dependent oxidoreductase
MRIGLALPHYEGSFPGGAPLSWRNLADAAVRAERLGFDSVWVSDHFFLDLSRYGGEPGSLEGSVEPFTALAAIAAVTERVRMGTLVACAPFRHPAHLAKMATTIDLVSEGRFDLGLGAGWYEQEFASFGFEYGTVGSRFAYLEEAVEVVSALFGEGPVDHDGARFHLSGAFNRPRPAQAGGPPIWIGGKGGDRQLRLVARRAAGWNTVWRWTPADFAGRVARLHELCEAEGRDPSSVRASVGTYALVGEDRADLERRFGRFQAAMPGHALDGTDVEGFGSGAVVGTPEQVLETLAAFAQAGAEEFIAGAGPLPFNVADWSDVELFAESVIPRAHELSWTTSTRP